MRNVITQHRLKKVVAYWDLSQNRKLVNYNHLDSHIVSASPCRRTCALYCKSKREDVKSFGDEYDTQVFQNVSIKLAALWFYDNHRFSVCYSKTTKIR